MNIPKGYKQTELGVIPEDWDVKTIGDYYEVTSSKRIFQSQWRHIGIPFYRAREIVVLAEKRKVDNELFIDQELYDLYKRQYGVPQAGDVLVTGVGTLGRLYVVQSNDSPFYFKDGNIIWFKNKGYNSVLLSYLYQTDPVINQITDNSGGSTVGTYTIQNAINTKIITPNLPAEQDAIAKALSDVDALIAALDKKIIKKRLIKQGAMHYFATKQLLSQKVKIGELGKWGKGQSFSKEQILPNGKYKCIHYGELFGYDEVIDKVKSTTNTQPIKKSSGQDILFPASDVTPIGLGRCSALQSKGILLGGDIIILELKNEYAPAYISYVINQNKQQIIDRVTGTTVKHINSKQLSEITIEITLNRQEQMRIASILSDMDKEIADLEARRDKYKLIKSGMMQKLLTGQIRLKSL